MKDREKETNRKEETGHNGMRLRFQKGDFIAIGAVLLLAVAVLLLFLPAKSASGGVAEIYKDGVLIKTVPLNADTELTVENGYTNVITVRDGKIAFTDADCPGEDCVHSGWIDSPGRSLVCLPNRVEIRVVSGESDVDFVVG